MASRAKLGHKRGLCKMGFRIATKATLVLADTAWAGAEVVCRLNAPIDGVLSMSDGPDKAALATWFTAAAESWNLEDDSGPLPCTAENFAQLPTGFQLRLYSTWVGLATGVAAPLGQRSPNGVLAP